MWPEVMPCRCASDQGRATRASSLVLLSLAAASACERPVTGRGAEAAAPPAASAAPAAAAAPDVSPPPPTALAAALVSPTEVQLRWTPAGDGAGVAGYQVLRGSEVVSTVTTPAARLSGLEPGRTHCYSVRALDASRGCSERSEEACVATPDVTAPSAPTRLAAEVARGRVELRWSPARDDVGVAGYEVLRQGALVARVARTWASEPGVSPGVPVCYTVVALDAAGNRSAAAGPVCATPPDVTPPSTPGEIASRADSETVLALGWSPAADDVGVDRYELLRQEEVVARTDATEARISGLRAAVEYCHAVRACDAAGNCSRPSAEACATMPDLTPPLPVTEVTARADSDRSVKVGWAPARDNVGVASYRLRRDGAKVLDAAGDATCAEDGGLSPATRYCYLLVAVDAAGNESAPSQPACAVTPDLVPPTVPPRVAAAPRSATELVLAWGASTDDVRVAGYEVLRDGTVVATIEGTRARAGKLGPETEYCHSVRAFDAAGNRSEPSEPACARTAAPSTPAAPGDLRAHVTPQRELLLTWEPSPDPGAVYAIYWDRKGRVDRRIGTTAASSFKVFGKAAAERHCYRVVALDAGERMSPPTLPVCSHVPGGRTGADQARGPVPSLSR